MEITMPICYPFYKRIERFLPGPIRGLWPMRRPSQPIPKPRLNADRLAEAIHPFMYESIVALWFVDEPAEYHALLRDKARHETFRRIPTYLFLSAAYSKEELARCPAFCREPGLWLEMEDGNHRKLEGWRDE